jgi:hypothetical protein
LQARPSSAESVRRLRRSSCRGRRRAAVAVDGTGLLQLLHGTVDKETGTWYRISSRSLEIDRIIRIAIFLPARRAAASRVFLIGLLGVGLIFVALTLNFAIGVWLRYGHLYSQENIRDSLDHAGAAYFLLLDHLQVAHYRLLLLSSRRDAAVPQAPSPSALTYSRGKRGSRRA